MTLLELLRHLPPVRCSSSELSSVLADLLLITNQSVTMSRHNTSHSVLLLSLSFFVLFFLSLSSSCHGAKYRVTSQVFMRFRHGSQPLGKVVFGLFGEDAPKTVENFRTLCTEGIEGRTYAGTRIHRIIERFLIQGGDLVSDDGNGAVSIYGETFEDENTSINHTGPGFLGMANRGPDTNGCQFYVTAMATPWLDGKHTIFGKVVEEQGIIHAIEKVKTDSDDRPLAPVIITECGDEPLNAPFFVSDDPYE